MSALLESIAHWNKLADEQTRWAEYLEGRGEYGGTHRNRAHLYQRTAQAIQMTIDTGKWHCACCHKTSCDRAAQRRGER